jgi:triacylglycerol lipase
LIDWGRFVRAWKKEEKIQRDTAASATSGHAQPAPAGEELKNTDGAVIKNSTEKLTSTFDWLVEQVPGAPRLVSKGKSEDASIRTKEEVAQMRGDEKHAKEEGKETRKKSELARKEDLERFYVALSRKMYDEGF